MAYLIRKRSYVTFPLDTVYAGQEPSSSFLSRFEFVYYVPNSTIENVIHKSLQRANVKYPTTIKAGDKVWFEYEYNGETISFTPYDNVVGSYLYAMGLHETEGTSQVILENTFTEGHKINPRTLDPEQMGNLKYQDHSTIPVSEVITSTVSVQVKENEDSELWSNYTNLPLSMNLNGKRMRYVIPTYYFGNVFYETTLTINQLEIPKTITKLKIYKYKVNINANEIYNITDDTYAEITYTNSISNSEIIETVQASDFASKGITCSLIGQRITSLYFSRNIYYAIFKVGDVSCNVPFVVSYYDTNLTIESDETFNNKFYVTEDKILNLSKTGLTIYARLNKNNAVVSTNGTVRVTSMIEKQDVTSSAYLTGVSVKIDDLNNNEPTKYSSVITYTNNQYGQTMNATLDVLVYKKAPIEFIIEGTDTTVYYNSGVSKFQYPSGLTFKLLFNDETEEEYTGDITELVYCKYKELSENDILTTNSVIKGNLPVIYVYSPEYDIWGQYDVVYVDDPITNVSLDDEDTIKIIKGNYLAKYKQEIFSCIKVTYASGVIKYLSEVENINNFAILNNELILDNTLEHILISINEEIYDLNDLSMIEYENPTLASATLNLNGLATEYSNNTSFDLKKPTISFKYENATYEEVVEFDEITITSEKGYIVIENYVASINVDELTTVTDTLSFSATSLFGDSITLTQDIKIYGIKDIIRIRITSAYTQYEVGDTFLNDNDTTTISLDVTDSLGNETTIDNVRLNGGFSLINVNPLKGTKFTTIEQNKVVRISYSGNSNVIAEYMINVGAKELTATSTRKYKIVACWLDRDRYIEDKVEPSTRAYTTRAVVGGGSSGGNIENLAQTPYLNKYILVKNNNFAEDFEIEELRGQLTTYIDENGVRQLNTGYNLYKTVEAMKKADYFVGYLEDVNNKTVNARVILFKDYVAPIKSESNIEVKYPCYVEGNADYINKCKFGILFGNVNARNRLFLSGNENLPNCDWHSNEVSSSFTNMDLNGNFTYFEDLSYCFYGETDNKIVGYDIVSNDKLLVLKDKSDKETTVYFRTPRLISAISGSGEEQRGLNNEVLYQEVFALVQGNNSVAGVNPNSITNLNGDTLFISDENKIVGLDLEGIVGDNQRYANTRSIYIDEALKKVDLSNAKLWTNNNDLYVVLDDYIFMTTKDLIIDKQYEWFVMNIPKVSSILEVNGIKYYGTKEGKLYKTNDEYNDIHKTFIGEGGVLATLHVDNYVIYTNEDYLKSIDLSKRHTFKILPSTNDYMYQQIATISNMLSDKPMFFSNYDSPNLRLMIEDEEELRKWLNLTQEDKDIYFNDIELIDTSVKTIAYNKKYRLVRYYDLDVSLDYIYYQVLDEDNNPVDVRNIRTATICYKLDEEYEIYDIDLEQSSFKLKYNDYEVDIVKYNVQSNTMNVTAVIKEYEDVECYYITKPYDFGTLNYNKTIYGWALTNDTGIPSWLEVTYTNNKIPYNSTKTLMNVSVDKLSVDFNVLDFNKVDLEKNIVPRVNANYRILPNVNFICFGFRNKGNTNSVLSKMTITYTVSSPAYGSR